MPDDSILETVAPVGPRSTPVCIALEAAMLCLGCDWIYPADSPDCPRCHSAVRFPVARVLTPSSTPRLPWLAADNPKEEA